MKRRFLINRGKLRRYKKIKAKEDMDKELTRRFLETFESISSNPRSPQFILNKYYRHFQLDTNLFITLCFDQQPTTDYDDFIQYSMISLSDSYFSTKSKRSKGLIFTDIQDYLISLDGISGIINITFNPKNMDEVIIALSDKEEYFKNVTCH